MAGEGKDHDGGDAASSGLTINEMMEKYPRKKVEQAMFTRNYAEFRHKQILEYQDRIAKGTNVELNRRLLQRFMKETPPTPPTDPSEPTDLDHEVLWRMRVLKYELRPTAYDDARVNIDAVLDAYREGRLKKVDDNITTIWYAGQMIMGPMSNKDPKLQELGLELPRLEKEYGLGDFWSEDTISVPGK